jgi:serine/threonine-protein kinase
VSGSDTIPPDRKRSKTTEPPGDPGLWSEELLPGAQLGAYTIERLVARAGFANVYRAAEMGNGRPVAIKILRHQIAQTRNGKERFQREFEALRDLQHPNVLSMFQHGALPDGRPFIVMEWLDGVTLDDFMAGRTLPVGEVLTIVEQLCAALSAAHAAGVIHRDLKGSNVMLAKTADGVRVKLVDFGIVKPIDPQEAARAALTTTGQALGTPYCMAPEQITGRRLDARTDIYALGVLMFEMLSGKKPFEGQSAIEVADKHLSVKPARLVNIAAVPEALDNVVQRCLAKSPDHRYSTPAEVAAALAGVEVERSGHVAQPKAKSVLALGLHFEVLLRAHEDDQEDEEILDALEDFRERALAATKSIGMRVAVSTDRSFLALQPLSDGTRAKDMQIAVIDTARRLLTWLEGENRRPDQVAFSMTIHRGTVDTEFHGKTEFTGGELLELARWVSAQPGLVVTPAAQV